MNLKKIAIIPARSGSKGLPNKNILMLLDKPLIAYTIKAAIDSNMFEKVIVTTDSIEYKEISEKYGAEVFLRSEKLSNDMATSYMVIEDVLNRLNNIYDYFVLLQPTSPFRESFHIKEAINNFEMNYNNFDFLVSMCESCKSSELIKIIDNDKTLKNYTLNYSNYKRQNFKEYYPNGAIFIGKIDSYLKQKHFFGEKSLAYFMSKENSLDIDDSLDFEIAIQIMTKKYKEKALIQNIKNRINEKKQFFSQKKPITLIGHSIFDYWNIQTLNGLQINNLGIAGINTKQYIDFILNKNLINTIGNIVILFVGTNDIVIKKWKKEDTLNWIKIIIEKLKNINPNVKIYLIETPRVFSRMDRNNTTIKELNCFLNAVLDEKLQFIELGEIFQDKFGNLKLEYTYDGLHFNDNGYKMLKKIIEKKLKVELEL